jgi:hypothetical protein
MYSRTINETGHTTSRCLYCFMTVASETEGPGELDRIEARHVCPEKALAHLLAREHFGFVQTCMQAK